MKLLNIFYTFLVVFIHPTFGQKFVHDPTSSKCVHFVAESITSTSDMEESCTNFEACSYMKYHGKAYKLPGSAKENFETLVTLSPTKIWDNHSHFEFVFDPLQNQFITPAGELPTLAVGQVYFLDLTILKLMTIPVAFKIVELDRENLVLSFSYIKNNKSNGVQRVSFRDKDGATEVFHETRFESTSKLRDAVMYRPFHTLLLNDFYKRFKMKI